MRWFLLDAETRRTIYLVLKGVYDEEVDACLECTDIDCGRNSIRRYFQKKHRMDVVDHRACLKEKREFASNIKKILEQPLFRRENSISCEYCGKSFKRTQSPWPLRIHFVKLPVKKRYVCHRVCRRCKNKAEKAEMKSASRLADKIMRKSERFQRMSKK